MRGRSGKRFLRLTGLSGQRVLRFDGGFAAEGCGIAAFGGDEYIVSVTGFALVSPVLHDVEQKPPSLGRGWRR